MHCTISCSNHITRVNIAHEHTIFIAVVWCEDALVTKLYFYINFQNCTSESQQHISTATAINLRLDVSVSFILYIVLLQLNRSFEKYLILYHLKKHIQKCK